MRGARLKCPARPEMVGVGVAHSVLHPASADAAREDTREGCGIAELPERAKRGIEVPVRGDIGSIVQPRVSRISSGRKVPWDLAESVARVFGPELR